MSEAKPFSSSKQSEIQEAAWAFAQGDALDCTDFPA